MNCFFAVRTYGRKQSSSIRVRFGLNGNCVQQGSTRFVVQTRLKRVSTEDPHYWLFLDLSRSCRVDDLRITPSELARLFLFLNQTFVHLFHILPPFIIIIIWPLLISRRPKILFCKHVQAHTKYLLHISIYKCQLTNRISSITKWQTDSSIGYQTTKHRSHVTGGFSRKPTALAY